MATQACTVPRLVGVTLLVLLSVVLAACGPSAGPKVTAQRFADALIEEKYAEAAAQVDAATDRSGFSSPDMLSFWRAMLTSAVGTLRSAEAQQPAQSDATSATVQVVWQAETKDVATTFVLRRFGSDWKIVDVQNDVVEGVVNDDGSFVTPTVAAPTPVPTRTPVPTPAERTVEVAISGLEELPSEVQRLVTVRAEEAGIALRGYDSFSGSLPLGEHTLRLSVPGHRDATLELTVEGEREVRNPLLMSPGERLPFDPQTQALVSEQNDGRYRLATLGPDGLTYSWHQDLGWLRGLDQSGQTLLFANQQGIGAVGVDGGMTYRWHVPEGLSNILYRTWTYSPDFGEIAYISNKDLFTVATDSQAAAATQWTELGVFTNIVGYWDADTVLAQGNNELYIVRRDGSSYSTGEPAGPGGLEPIYGPRGELRFLESQGTLYQPGPRELIEQVFIEPSFLSLKTYGWTGDGQHYLVHSAEQDAGPLRGIVAVSTDGKTRQLAAELRPGSSGFGATLDTRIGAFAFEPSGSRMALVWRSDDASAGVYVVDAAGGGAKLIADAQPEQLFWPRSAELVYSVKDGPDMGTWLAAADGGAPRKLFAYRAEQALQAPGGDLLLIANNTLWRYAGSGEPGALGEPGEQRMLARMRLLDAQR